MVAALLALDIGGTKTDIVGEDGDGRRLFAAKVPSAGWDAEPERDGARWIAGHVGAVLPAAIEVALLSFGAQGINNDAVARNLEAALAAEGFAARAHNDADLIVPAAGLDAGIGLIAGTGSIAVSRDAAGRRLSAGGWGCVIGDEGGGAALVREAARAALRAHDSGTPDDGLLGALIAAFGVPDPERLTRRVNDIPTMENWAPHVPTVFAAADAGSRLAQEVVAGGGAALALIAGQLVKRGAIGSDVVAAGSVIVNQQRLFAAFGQALAERHPELKARLLDRPPVEGAAFLGRRYLGWR